MRYATFALLLACAACISAPATSDPARFAARVRGGLDVSHHDFEANRFWAQTPEARTRWRDATLAALGDSDHGCRPADIRAVEALPWIELALAAPDAATWRADAEALHTAGARLNALTAARANGASDLDMNDSITGFQREMLAAATPR